MGVTDAQSVGKSRVGFSPYKTAAGIQRTVRVPEVQGYILSLDGRIILINSEMEMGFPGVAGVPACCELLTYVHRITRSDQHTILFKVCIECARPVQPASQ